MSSRDKYGKFKKKDYMRILRGVCEYLCEEFGYKKKPLLLETQLDKTSLMFFVHRGKRCAILHDYQQFKKHFGDQSFSVQEAYAAAIVAHEMRHYYQHRQMLAAQPRESEERVALWRENEENLKVPEDGASLKECILQPLEVDASLFEYVFGAEEFNYVLYKCIADEEHLDAMEKLHVEYFGETDERLFGEKVRETIRSCNEDT